MINISDCLIDTDLNSARTTTFSKIYPQLNNYLFKKGYGQSSRYGQTKEVIDFKTHITSPINRCVGGYNRDINVFFLLAEAMWIFVGRKDVKFLKIFNSRMEEFSDDKKVFHAPYGFRLRHWGVSSSEKSSEESNHHIQGKDQILEALNMLSEDPESRRVVMSIWNPDLDLGTSGVDIPCNDLLMLKIREQKLILTVSNRSNDLHWGLPTNVFQFSFLGEVIAKILRVKYSSQTHISQSLHFYTKNEIAQEMYLSYERQQKKQDLFDIYEYCQASEMDFKFGGFNVESRLNETTTAMNIAIEQLEKYEEFGFEDEFELDKLKRFSPYLMNIYKMLKTYIQYKKGIELNNSDLSKEENRKLAFHRIVTLNHSISGDYKLLALNWFAKRIKDTEFVHKTIQTSRHIGHF